METVHILAIAMILAVGFISIMVILSSFAKGLDKIATQLEREGYDALGRMNEVNDWINKETQAAAGYHVVTCGGCGRLVPTMDGFNPQDHDCDGIDDSLIAK